jgi:hypothetical protein
VNLFDALGRMFSGMANVIGTTLSDIRYSAAEAAAGPEAWANINETYFHNLYSQTKDKTKTYPALRILGVQDIVFKEATVKAIDKTAAAYDALTVTLDTTTSPDSAMITLKNDRGFDVYLRAMFINANLIYQYSGVNQGLLHDGLRKDDDIRRNGERCLEIGNSFIVDATQCANIADFWWKFAGKKKHLYSVSIPGFSYWYEVGEWYTLSIGGPGTNEYISCTVECYAVDCERSAGGVGSTNLLLRDVEDSWSKTTLYTARLVSGGSPKRRVNRSNIVTVASSTYDGTYDYRCDGTADDVQIQAAIDYVSQTVGGGSVLLTAGTYVLNTYISVKSNVLLSGTGWGTIIRPKAATTGIQLSDVDNVVLQDFEINYNGGVINTSIGIIENTIGSTNIVKNIKITNGIPSPGTNNYYIDSTGAYSNTLVVNCVIDSLIATSGDTGVIGINGVTMATNNKLGTFTAFGSGVGYGMLNCKKCQQNIVAGANTNKYQDSYADAGTSNACADNANGGFNS